MTFSIIIMVATLLVLNARINKLQKEVERLGECTKLMSDNVDYMFYVMKEEIKPKCTYGEWLVKRYVFPKKGEEDELNN